MEQEPQRLQAHEEERFTPGEVVEILKIAASLQNDYFGPTDLRSIAREAGIGEEALEEAIAQYRERQRQLQQQREKQLREQEEAERYTRQQIRQISTAAILLILFLLAFLVMVSIMDSKMTNTHERMIQQMPSPFLMQSPREDTTNRIMFETLEKIRRTPPMR
jgi:Fe2+ transport system protein B